MIVMLSTILTWFCAISLAQDNFRLASSSLEQALSLRFEIRQTPIYHIIKARLLEASGSNDEALKMVEAGLALPGVRRAVDASTINKDSKDKDAKSGAAAGSAGAAPAAPVAQLAVGVGVAMIFSGSGIGATVQLADRITMFILAIRLNAKVRTQFNFFSFWFALFYVRRNVWLIVIAFFNLCSDGHTFFTVFVTFTLLLLLFSWAVRPTAPSCWWRPKLSLPPPLRRFVYS